MFLRRNARSLSADIIRSVPAYTDDYPVLFEMFLLWGHPNGLSNFSNGLSKCSGTSLHNHQQNTLKPRFMTTSIYRWTGCGLSKHLNGHQTHTFKKTWLGLRVLRRWQYRNWTGLNDLLRFRFVDAGHERIYHQHSHDPRSKVLDHERCDSCQAYRRLRTGWYTYCPVNAFLFNPIIS